MKALEKFSMGVGDRFAHQGMAQLAAFERLASRDKVIVVPVWNKSRREHSIIGTQPESVLHAAKAAVEASRWPHPWHVDADHINLKSVDAFIATADFFTLDVAEFMGETLAESEITAFIARHKNLLGDQHIEGLSAPLTLTQGEVAEYLRNALFAVQQAGRLYRHIVAERGSDNFVTELSMDETIAAQTPGMLYVILAAVAEEGIPIQTIAPKFSGRFNKGVDYVGDPNLFAREFEDDICVIRAAIKRFGLPATLKLSVHSGSDKCSIYPHIARIMTRHNAGVHLKTAGTTWLEELIGLALAGDAGLTIAKDIYALALPRFDELCAPYASVIEIDPNRLPTLSMVAGWSGADFAAALKHVPSEPRFNADFRQFLHVSFKIAAEIGVRYLHALRDCKSVIAEQVTENVYARHLKPIFGMTTSSDY